MHDEEVIKDFAHKAEEEIKHEEKKHNEVDHMHHAVRRYYLFAAGIFLVLLMVSFTFVTFPIADIIVSTLQSNPLEDNIIDLNNFEVIFDQDTLAELQTIYFNEQKVEFSVCLSGEKRGPDYYINSLYQPKMFEQTFNHVNFAPCNQETLLLLHSHPYKRCTASETDLNTLRKTQESNPDILMVVMCEPSRFSIYS